MPGRTEGGLLPSATLSGEHQPLAGKRRFKVACGVLTHVDRERLEDALQEQFGGDDATVRAISRQARDLADSGLVEADFDYAVTVETVVDDLADAPDSHSLVERWNWWIGSLNLATGGYRRFRVRPDVV